MLGFQYLFLFAILAFRALLYVYDWFISKIINFIVKHYYVASVLLDFSLIALVIYIKMYGFNHFWLYFFVGSLVYAFLMYNFGLFYSFLSGRLSNLSEWLSKKLFDLKLWLKYDLKLWLKYNVKFGIEKLLRRMFNRIKKWIKNGNTSKF